MRTLPQLIPAIASQFQRYITLHRLHPTRKYTYAARGSELRPVIESTIHLPKCRIGESWLYMAVPAGVSLSDLGQHDFLYVGAQTADRMFRGDGMGATNFHHAEMRKGRGSDSLEAYLQSGRSVAVWRVSGKAIASSVASSPSLAALSPLLNQAPSRGTHLGYWFEQYLLLTHFPQWRWNERTASSKVRGLFGSSE